MLGHRSHGLVRNMNVYAKSSNGTAQPTVAFMVCDDRTWYGTSTSVKNMTSGQQNEQNGQYDQDYEKIREKGLDETQTFKPLSSNQMQRSLFFFFLARSKNTAIKQKVVQYSTMPGIVVRKVQQIRLCHVKLKKMTNQHIGESRNRRETEKKKNFSKKMRQRAYGVIPK